MTAVHPEAFSTRDAARAEARRVHRQTGVLRWCWCCPCGAWHVTDGRDAPAGTKLYPTDAGRGRAAS
jgi:hypothetical protein